MQSKVSSSFMLQFFNRSKEVTQEDYEKMCFFFFCHLDFQNFADIVILETHLLEEWHGGFTLH